MKTTYTVGTSGRTDTKPYSSQAEARKKLDELIAQGIVTPATMPTTPLPLPVVPKTGATVSDLIAEQRG